jgi:hypothetical protein
LDYLDICDKLLSFKRSKDNLRISEKRYSS